MPLDATDAPDYIPPNAFHVTIPDVDQAQLTAVVKYEFELEDTWWDSPVTSKPFFPMEVLIRGRYNRLYVPLIVASWRNMQAPKWVLFIIDTTSPHTYLSKATFLKLGYEADDAPRIDTEMMIHGYPITVAPSHSGFAEINILGQDYLTFTKAELELYYECSYGQLRACRPNANVSFL